MKRGELYLSVHLEEYKTGKNPILKCKGRPKESLRLIVNALKKLGVLNENFKIENEGDFNNVKRSNL